MPGRSATGERVEAPNELVGLLGREPLVREYKSTEASDERNVKMPFSGTAVFSWSDSYRYSTMRADRSAVTTTVMLAGTLEIRSRRLAGIPLSGVPTSI